MSEAAIYRPIRLGDRTRAYEIGQETYMSDFIYELTDAEAWNSITQCMEELDIDGAEGYFSTEHCVGTATYQIDMVDGRWFGKTVDIRDAGTWINKEFVDEYDAHINAGELPFPADESFIDMSGRNVTKIGAGVMLSTHKKIEVRCYHVSGCENFLLEHVCGDKIIRRIETPLESVNTIEGMECNEPLGSWIFSWKIESPRGASIKTGFRKFNPRAGITKKAVRSGCNPDEIVLSNARKALTSLEDGQ